MTKKILSILFALCLASGCSNMMSEKISSQNLFNAPDPAGAVNHSFSIYNGFEFVYSISTFLVINVDNISDMCFSNDNSAWSQWEQYRPVTNWNLHAGSGLKTVYARLRRENGDVIELSDTITYINKVNAENPVAELRLGYCTSISSNGDTVIAGTNINTGGRAYVYRWNVVNWEEALIQRDAGSPNDYFGTAVSISGDGNLAAIGSYGFSQQKGAVYMFKQNDVIANLWEESNAITASDGAGSDYFGYSLAMSKDKSTLVIGAPGRDMQAPAQAYFNAGAVYIYSRNYPASDSWGEVAKITAEDAVSEDRFGTRVAVSSDGAYIAVSSPNASQYRGAVYIYKRNSGNYVQVQKVTASNGCINDYFGSGLSISDNGTVLASGSPGRDISGRLNQGCVYIFEYDGTAWIERDILNPSNGGSDDMFGNSLSLSSDGGTIAVGSRLHDASAGIDSGCAYIFRRNGASYEEHKIHTALDGDYGHLLGTSVSISSNGSITAAGSIGDSSVLDRAGSVYIFSD